MKFMKIIVLVLLLIGAQTAYGISAFDIRWGTDLNSNMRSNTLKQWTESIEGRVTGSGGMGNHYYVDSGVVTEGDGTSWADARDTLDEAVALCTADNGDVIHVRAGHTEDWTAADSADLDVAGITVIGEGQGEARPLFTLDGAAAELVMGDASIMITNLRFMASVDSTVHIIEVEDDADGFIIYNCEFMEPESADTTDEADDIIQVAAGANQGFIVGNTFYSLSAGAKTAIDLTAGVIEDITVAYNYINGAFSEGAIFSDDIDLRCRIIGNTVIQLDAAMTPITFNTTATGIMEDNWCTSKSTTYLIDAGSMHCKGNMWSDTDTADAAAVPMYTSETGVDIWAASQTTQITTASTAAIEADHLDHLAAVSVADEIVNESFLADITSGTQDWSTFVSSTDSLEAISNKITALTGYIHAGTNSAATSTTPVVAALIGYGEDYFNTDWVMVVLLNVDAPGTAPEGDVRDITNYVTATGTFTIDTTSAALANTDIVMVARKEAFVLAGIKSGTGAYPTGVANDSILAMILSKGAEAAASTYVNSTDSLEMISDKLGAFAGTAGATVGESLYADIALAQVDIDAILADTEAMDEKAELVVLAGTAEISTTGVTGAPTASTLADTLHKDGSFTFDNTTDSLEAIADEQEYSMTITRTAGGALDLANGTNNLFVVSGPVEVMALGGIVTNALKTVANACKFIHTTTVPAAAVDLTSALECSADAAGASYTLNTTIGGALIATDAGTVATSTTVKFLAPAGTIGFNAAGTFDAGDAIQFYIKYKPLVSGSRVTASP